MSDRFHLPVRDRKVRGTRQELKQFCKSKNISTKWIEHDKKGFFIKLINR